MTIITRYECNLCGVESDRNFHPMAWMEDDRGRRIGQKLSLAGEFRGELHLCEKHANRVTDVLKITRGRL